MTGKKQLAVGSWHLAEKPVSGGQSQIRGFVRTGSDSDWALQSKIQNPKSKIERGFSLFELMIAMFILIILLSVAVPVYQRTVQHAKETVLQENLWQMRRAVEQYRADKGKLPTGLEDLVEAKYLREIPIDPILDKAEWDAQMGEDPSSQEGEQGVVDVKSTSPGQDSAGKQYSEY